MFADAFLPNLLVFVLGQIAAWGYVRTGLVVRGAIAMVICWTAADFALVARFAFSETGTSYRAALLMMQVWSLVEFVLFVTGRVLRRSPARRAERSRLLREAGIHWLRDEADQARPIYARLVRRDPWDVEAALGLATIFADAGATRPARAWLGRVRSLDTTKALADVVELELERLADPVKD